MNASESTTLTWPGVLSTLVRGQDLTGEQTGWAMNRIMAGDASPVALSSFLTGLGAKGETVVELAALADVMLLHARSLDVPSEVLDIVGTGGDGARTVNISTMASLVAAGAGVPVVKHGNRAATSASGSADVLEALGVRLDDDPVEVARVFREVGITFCFAQTFHPSFRHAVPVRRELGIPTAFNVLGPLTNPARPAASAIGVASAQRAPLVAGVLALRGVSGVVFRSEDGLDELTTTAPARMWLVSSGVVTEQVIDLRDVLGLPSASISDLRGGDAQENAEVARRTVGGQPGPVREAVLLNAAEGLVALDLKDDTGARGLEDLFRVAYRRAAEAIDDGRASAVLDAWVTASRTR